jgi:flagellin
MNILSSLDRSNDGTVTASNITVGRQDLSTDAGVFGSGASLASNGTASAAAVANTAKTGVVSFSGTWAIGDTATVTVGGVELSYTAASAAVDDAASHFAGAINALGLEGVTASAAAGDLTISSARSFEGLSIAAATGTGSGISQITALNGTTGMTATSGDIAERAENIALSTSAIVVEGDSYKVTIGSSSFDYIAGKGETMEDVAKGLKMAIDGGGNADITTQAVQAANGQWSLKVDNNGASADFAVAGNSGGEASGGLFGLDAMDVSTTTGANAALDNIEMLINASINSAANFGSAQGRIEIQGNFISQLTDSFKSGIGSMVDADMEAASARLQALQVQQQLGVQALSIANQSPQSILSLFR